MGVAVIVLPVEVVRTTVYRTADGASADMAAVFIAPLAVGMVFSSLFQAALAGKLMLPVPQVLELRKAVGRCRRKLLITAPADTLVFRIVLFPSCGGMIAHANRD